jgi:pimeloyl-ACP methyl ester carboxylesterase
VFSEVSKTNTVIAYNRAGHGGSSSPQSERSGQAIVGELRTLLKSQGLRPPYILIGHSAGGLYMQLFARHYPDEVAGLILVDSTNPKQFDGQSALENQSPLVRGIEFWYSLFRSTTTKQEYRLLPDAGRSILQLPTIPGERVTVIQAKNSISVPGASDAENLVLNAYLKKLKMVEVENYPGCRLINSDSGHMVPIETPHAITEAVSRYLGARAVEKSWPQ